MRTKFKTLAELMKEFEEPQAGVEYFKEIRWGDNVTCPHCWHHKTYQLTRKNKYRCAKCLQNISVTVETIFAHTLLPLRIWLGTIWLITNRPGGIGSDDLARALGITQKSAWWALETLRHAVRTNSFNESLPSATPKRRRSAKSKEVGGSVRVRSGTLIANDGTSVSRQPRDATS